MKCIRYIKYKKIRANRNMRRLYVDDHGRFHDMKNVRRILYETQLAQERKCLKRNNIRG